MNGFLSSFKAFLDSPFKFLADPTNTTIAYQVKLMEAEGRTVAEIDQSLSETGLQKGSVVGTIFDGVTGFVGFMSKNLGLILVIVLLVVVGWYILMFRRAVE